MDEQESDPFRDQILGTKVGVNCKELLHDYYMITEPLGELVNSAVMSMEEDADHQQAYGYGIKIQGAALWALCKQSSDSFVRALGIDEVPVIAALATLNILPASVDDIATAVNAEYTKLYAGVTSFD
jgi:hypothetical protein